MLGLQTNVFCDTGFILFSGFLKLDQFAVTFFTSLSGGYYQMLNCSAKFEEECS